MIKNHSICDGNLYQIQSSKMNNRQYYKAKEKGPEGPLGFLINLPKKGDPSQCQRGQKEPRGFSVNHQKEESKPMQKGGQRATWVFSKPPKGESRPILKGANEPRGFSVNHLQRGIRALCQISAELLGKLVQREK